MSNIKITISSYGYRSLYSLVPATSLDIDVYVNYPSGRERRYSFDNYAKACAFVGRTISKRPEAKCFIHVPCQSVWFNFKHYSNSKPAPALKSVTLSMWNNKQRTD